MTYLFNWIVLIINLIIGASIMWYLIRPNAVHDLRCVFRFGLWIGALGLLGQAYRNGVYLHSGVSPTDNALPLWVLKDIGLWLIGASLLFHIIKELKDAAD